MIGFNLGYSIRRHFVDDFYFRNINLFHKDANVLDLGGKKVSKRGRFDLNKYPLNVFYANLDKDTSPDYLCDATHIPVSSSVFDGVICAETLEHVFEPKSVLKEIYRVLKADGILLISIPFLFPIHADPYDYGRHTDCYWERTLRTIGFKKITIEYQGGFFSVSAHFFKDFAYQIKKDYRFIGIILNLLAFATEKVFLRLDKVPFFKFQDRLKNYTTGFGIIAYKP